jgi:primosomal protein N''
MTTEELEIISKKIDESVEKRAVHKMSPDTKREFSLFSKDMEYLKDELKEVKDTMNKFIEKCDKCYISKDRFRPVEMITYGLISLVGGGFITALFYLLFRG